MNLIFKDAQSGETIVNIPVTLMTDEPTNYFVVDFKGSVYKTYDFMIDCALYGANEGQTHFGSYDDDNGKPLAFWALVERAI